MEKIECAVIGAGVIGLAVARALAAQGREVLILEAENAFGTGISARNSEVIHAGIYYPAGSLKARFCVTGRALLYDYCAERGIAHRRCGKLIVATNEAQREQLARIAAGATANGVDDLRRLTRDEARALEPALECTAALLSPSTGIIDSHGLMLSLLGDAERNGAILAVNSPVTGGEIVDGGIVLEVGSNGTWRCSSRPGVWSTAPGSAPRVLPAACASLPVETRATAVIMPRATITRWPAVRLFRT
jgi:L-2-hydroxyglutarate oxidase LhgO